MRVYPFAKTRLEVGVEVAGGIGDNVMFADPRCPIGEDGMELLCLLFGDVRSSAPRSLLYSVSCLLLTVGMPLSYVAVVAVVSVLVLLLPMVATAVFLLSLGLWCCGGGPFAVSLWVWFGFVGMCMTWWCVVCCW